MISGFNGLVTLTLSSLYIGIVWIAAGTVCAILARRRGTAVAVMFALLTAVLPQFVWIDTKGGIDIPQHKTRGEVTNYFDDGLIPFFGAIIGGLLGELIRPPAEE